MPNLRLSLLSVATAVLVAWGAASPFAAVIACAAEPTPAAAVSDDLALIRSVHPDGVGHSDAQAAAVRLSALPPQRATQVLDAMSGASPLVKNWLRVVAASVADNGEFPKADLLDFLADRSRDPDARHAAFQMLTARNSELVAELLEGAETDPSLPLRHLAIARRLERAEQEIKAEQTDAAIKSLRLVLAEGRNPGQLKAAAKSLEQLGQSVDLAEELAMLRRWWAMGSYDNTDSQHFETAYLPESTYLRTGRLPPSWLKADAAVGDGPAEQTVKAITSDDALGMIDLNEAFDNAKDAIAYAYGEVVVAPEDFEGKDAIAAQARLGCINANKVWVNGQLVSSNEVYHSGSRIDQYVGDCRLVPGLNTVLVKVCQNAQTESWARVWQFQFRFTDPTGAALRITTATPDKPQ